MLSLEVIMAEEFYEKLSAIAFKVNYICQLLSQFMLWLLILAYVYYNIATILTS